MRLGARLTTIIGGWSYIDLRARFLCLCLRQKKKSAKALSAAPITDPIVAPTITGVEALLGTPAPVVPLVGAASDPVVPVLPVPTRMPWTPDPEALVVRLFERALPLVRVPVANVVAVGELTSADELIISVKYVPVIVADSEAVFRLESP